MPRLLSALALAVIVCSPFAHAQEQHILNGIQTEIAYQYDSDTLENPLAVPSTVETHLVSLPGASSLRILFDVLELGPNDWIDMRSIYDNHSFRMTAEEARKWQNTSPYFNGSQVELRLVLAAGSQGRFAIRAVLSGAAGVAIDSICGSTDDRVNSTDWRALRFVSSATSTGGGCTIWLVSEDDCVLTAGHCMGSLAVAEMEVPQSLSSGTVQHPAPRFQFTIDLTGNQFVNGGPGNDWSFLRLNLNNQGESAATLAGGWYELGFYIPAVGTPIRITGYGSASGTRNSTNKTHAGFFDAASNGTILRYTADTTGGNSGSPVIDDSNGRAIGIHTHAGCTATGGSNQGTSLTLAAFRNGFNVFCPPMRFNVTVANGGLTASLQDFPANTSKVLTVWSLNTSNPAGSGLLFGITPDILTLGLLGTPSAPGNLFHTDAPFFPGLWPSAEFILPPGTLTGLAGLQLDAVAVAASNSSEVTTSVVQRVQL